MTHKKLVFRFNDYERKQNEQKKNPLKAEKTSDAGEKKKSHSI